MARTQVVRGAAVGGDRAASGGFQPDGGARRCTGVSKSYIYDLHHSLGGVYRPPNSRRTATAIWTARNAMSWHGCIEAGCSRCDEIARGWDARTSTISRELGRNRDPRTGRVPARTGAHRLAWQRQRRPKPSKMACQPRSCAQQVQTMLDQRLLTGPDRRPAEGAAPATIDPCGSATSRSIRASTSIRAARWHAS